MTTIRTGGRRRGLSVLLVSAVLVGTAACGQSASQGTTAPLLPPPAGAAASDGPVGPLRAPGGPYLLDRYGRTVILHGVNLVYKVPPYEVVVGGTGVNTLTVPEVQAMAAAGFDLVRLGIIWKGLEPGTAPMNDPSICAPGTPRASGPGQFDAAVFEGYLKQVDATVALLGRYGIMSLIDMHQDVYSDAFGGEGAPDWAVCTNGVTPEPVLDVPDWSVNLRGPGVVTAYEHFWRNDVVGNLQGEFDSIWSRVAGHFRDNPWVIGYDPSNEPYGAGVPPTGLGKAFDAELQCFYAGRSAPGTSQSGSPVSCPPDDPDRGVIARIEDADPNHLVFYEGNFATDSGPANHIGPMPFPRLVLNFHDYCFLHVPNGGEPADFGAICGPLEDVVFTQHATQAVRDATSAQPGGVPTFLTEFGATTDTADLARITGDADAHLVGWTYWQWLLYDDPTGSHTSGLWPPSAPTPGMLAILSRAYPAAIAGTPLAVSFDPTSGAFAFRYRNDPNVTAPTVVVVPVAAHYPGGYCAAVSGARVTSAPGAPVIDLQGGPRADVVSLHIAPGSCPTSSNSSVGLRHPA
ncbi:MAG TPA: cellulase family glycosylhydrolase [Acidimicrobiales bacterium]|nr:cellulase family glycosylhydrolase [Acidimicrobiales bacterium]